MNLFHLSLHILLFIAIWTWMSACNFSMILFHHWTLGTMYISDLLILFAQHVCNAYIGWVPTPHVPNFHAIIKLLYLHLWISIFALHLCMWPPSSLHMLNCSSQINYNVYCACCVMLRWCSCANAMCVV